MFRTSLAFVLIISLFACNKKIGGFQKSSRETFVQKSKITEAEVNTNTEILIQTEDISQVQSELTASESFDLPIENEFIKNIDSNKKLQERAEIKQIEVSTAITESSSAKETHDPLNNVKRNPVFNDSLKIGFVFLAIAIGMAFFPALLQLMVLFAVVSMVFLFIGLKKLFNRRAKMKQKKLRKEKNQERKEKIKDVFKK